MRFENWQLSALILLEFPSRVMYYFALSLTLSLVEGIQREEKEFKGVIYR